MEAVTLRRAGKGGGFRAAVAEMPVPRPPKGALLVKMQACGLCGTDIEKILGHYTASKPVIGHEAVGVVAELGPGVSGFVEGDRVFPHHHVPCHRCHLCTSGSETMCTHYRGSNLLPGGFAEYFVVPRWNVSGGGVLKIPRKMTFEIAALVEPLACCIRGLRRAGSDKVESALVIGAGPVGVMLAALLTLGGSEVVLADISEERLSLASKVGPWRSVNSKTEDMVRGVKQTSPDGPDLVMVATGSGPAILQALKAVRKGGTVCLFGVPAGGTVLDYDISELFNSERRLLTSYGATEADTTEALSILDSRKIDLRRLITHRFRLQDFDKALEAARGRHSLKVILTP